MLANGVKETTNTTGTGTITLNAVSGFVRFGDAFSVGDLAGYEIVSGNDREWGVGTVGASNTLARTRVIATLVSGVYDRTAPTAITLSGTSIVSCVDHAGTPRFLLPINKNRYFVPSGFTGRGLANSLLTANRQYYVPFMLPRNMEVNELGISVGTAVAASTVSIAIYDDTLVSGNNWPDTILASVSALDSATTGYKSGTVSLLLEAGHIYWASAIASHAISVYSVNATVDALALLGYSSENKSSATLYYEAGAGSTLATTAATALTAGDSQNPPGIHLKEL